MSPNLEGQIPAGPEIDTNSNSDQIHLILTPITDLSFSTSTSEGTPESGNESNQEEEVFDDLSDVAIVLRSFLPLEHNIRDLLVRVSNTERLETVTQIKLRVIARELALQQLGSYLPSLRELILDGSIVSSLRDLGSSLRNLKILRVNRCQLTCIDGVLGFEHLEELYAADNSIRDLSPCAFLTNLKIIDVRRNSVRHLGSLSFLSFCQDLNHLFLDGNQATEIPAHRHMIARTLPNLMLLDGEPLPKEITEAPMDDVEVVNLEEYDEDVDETIKMEASEKLVFSSRLAALSRTNPTTPEESRGFSVRFPPKVCESNGRTSNGTFT